MTTADDTYQKAIAQWRADVEAGLRAETGWLSVAGLFWIHEGANSVGSDPSNDIVLPSGAAPASIGSILLHNGEVMLEAAPDAGVNVNGKPVGSTTLHSDAQGAPDLVTVNDLTLFVIQRGARIGVRLRDKNSKARQSFTGRRWFPAREEYRVDAAFTPYDPPKTLAITNILGDLEDTPSPGYVVFSLAGQEYRLDAAPGHAGGLFLIFRDLTSGDETYPAGRFLNTPPPQHSQVTLDFNRAVSPPCAFTAFATCPLPPPQNRLLVRVEAGELYQGEH